MLFSDEFFASIQFANYLLFIAGHTCQSSKSFLRTQVLLLLDQPGLPCFALQLEDNRLEAEYMAASTQ